MALLPVDQHSVEFIILVARQMNRRSTGWIDCFPESGFPMKAIRFFLRYTIARSVLSCRENNQQQMHDGGS
ncbi:MAG: hypothetical protein A2W28_10880 [Gammaproteobacteria bacterium RBG_16_51_14]|nr:MAG: hypothetical protein A2W28_10880 [Gammaproteobacteria bacterium RBG_16_51_14]